MRNGRDSQLKSKKGLSDSDRQLLSNFNDIMFSSVNPSKKLSNVLVYFKERCQVVSNLFGQYRQNMSVDTRSSLLKNLSVCYYLRLLVNRLDTGKSHVNTVSSLMREVASIALSFEPFPGQAQKVGSIADDGYNQQSGLELNKLIATFAKIMSSDPKVSRQFKRVRLNTLKQEMLALANELVSSLHANVIKLPNVLPPFGVFSSISRSFEVCKKSFDAIGEIDNALVVFNRIERNSQSQNRSGLMHESKQLKQEEKSGCEESKGASLS